MAKKSEEGLPYLKFTPIKWITGDISECTLAAQGLFMNLCSLYWIKQGRLSFEAMKRKFPRKSRLFGELLERGILKSSGDDLVISFLDKQLMERGLVSETNRKAAEIRWNQNKTDADALQTHNRMHSERNPIKEEKREEEKRREESDTRAREGMEILIDAEPPGKNDVFKEIFLDERFMAELARGHPKKNIERAWEECWLYHSQKPSPPIHAWEWRQKLSTWLINMKNDVTSKTKQQRNTDDLIAGFAARYGSDANAG